MVGCGRYPDEIASLIVTAITALSLGDRFTSPSQLILTEFNQPNKNAKVNLFPFYPLAKRVKSLLVVSTRI
jgi:hypothetical protein